MAKQSSSNTTVVGGLSGIFIILVALIAQYFLGIDVLNIDDDSADNQPAAVEETVTGGDWYTLYFTTPINTEDRTQHVGSQIETDIITAINNAERSIDAAFYELNLESITNALIAARTRNVDVRLVVDDEAFILEEFTHPEDSSFDLLEDAGFRLYCEDEGETPSTYDMRCDDRSALMHHKFMIIDGSVVWMGSMNFTHNGIYNNSNNVMEIRSSRLAQNYQYMFDLMFEQGEFNLPGTDGYDVPNRRVTLNATPQNVVIEQYFSPDDGRQAEQRLIELMEGASESIRILAFSFTLDDVGDAILDRHQAGVDVRGIWENTGSIRGGQLPKLGCAGVPVKQDGNPDVLHHKVFIIDNEIVVTGSFNFSASARDNNSENLLIIESAELARQFTEEFNRWFDDPRADVPSREEMGC